MFITSHKYLINFSHLISLSEVMSYPFRDTHGPRVVDVEDTGDYARASTA